MSNEELKKEIIETERKTHRSVTELLEKFEKYSTATKVLAEKHKDELKISLQQFSETKQKVDSELESKQCVEVLKSFWN